MAWASSSTVTGCATWATASTASWPSSWVVARSAIVITPQRSRELTAGLKAGAKPPTIEEVFLALAPQEVAAFGQALAQGVTMIAAPRSGQPGTSSDEIQDSKPADVNAELRRMLVGDGEGSGDGDGSEPTFGMVEVIRGGQRQTVTVPRSRKEDDGR